MGSRPEPRPERVSSTADAHRQEVQALRREVERLRALARGGGVLEAVLQHSPHGIIVCDARGELVMQNRASERIWAGSSTADDVEAWGSYRAYHPDGRPFEPDDWSMARCLRTGAAVDAEEIRFQRFDGTFGVLLGSCAPIYGSDGGLEGAMSVFADVTRFKDLEVALVAAERRALQDTERLYRLADAANRAATPEEVFEPALEAITGGLRVERASILLLDRDGVTRFKAWRGLSDGYRAAVEGHTPWSADARDPAPIVVPDVSQVPDLAGYAALFAAEGIRALGFVPLVHQGRVLGKFMVYAPEVRTLTPAELQLAVTIASHISQAVARSRLHAEAEAANRAKDEFISLLGHELRNPLSPIVTALHLMRMRDHSTFARERGVIERQVKHLGRLVDDLLDVARITRGVVELRTGPVGLDEVIRKGVEMAAPLLEEREQHLEVIVPDDLVLNVDEARLSQVIGNLLTNAAKFTEPGGRIRVSTEARADEIEIRVADEGVGIDPELLPRIFDLFSQGSRPRTSVQGGLGLGLSIVRSLVELHGGTVVARSPGPGRGAEFVILLPRTAPVTGAFTGTPSSALPRAGAPRRVLVVDDNVDAANLLAEALGRAGHWARCAYDGPSALRLAEEFLPEICLLDIGLPVMDGYEVAERLAASEALPGVRLVAVTGYGQATDRARALGRGFVEHLTKPVDPDTLLDLLERWMA